MGLMVIHLCNDDDLFGHCRDLDDPYPLVLESDKESVEDNRQNFILLLHDGDGILSRVIFLRSRLSDDLQK